MYNSQPEAKDYRQPLHGNKAAAFKERTLFRNPTMPSIILLHRLWRSSDMAGLANDYGLLREIPPRAASNASLPGELNAFYARFKGAEQAPRLNRLGCCGVGREFQIPWCPHHQQTMVQTHQDSHEEGRTTRIMLYTTPFTEQSKLAVTRIERGVEGPGAQLSMANRDFAINLFITFWSICKLPSYKLRQQTL